VFGFGNHLHPRLRRLEAFYDSTRGNLPPVSAARWQHVSQICFTTLIELKITKFVISQKALKLDKN
jgi:hypothetical protein